MACTLQTGGAMNQINAVTIGKLIAAHREGDEEKFKAYKQDAGTRRRAGIHLPDH